MVVLFLFGWLWCCGGGGWYGTYHNMVVGGGVWRRWDGWLVLVGVSRGSPLKTSTTFDSFFTMDDVNTSFHRSTSSSGTNESESERLSQDLAIFLSNPALSSKLTDGSLNLASYSSTINSELAVLEKECIQLHRSAEDDVKVLRDEMGVCDEILAGLQEMLLVSLF